MTTQTAGRARRAYFFTAGCVMIVFGFASAANADIKPKNSREAAVMHFLEMIFDQGKAAEAFEQYGGPYYRQHNPMFPDGKEVLIAALKQLPPEVKFHYEFKRILSDHDMVIVHSRVTKDAADRGNAVVDFFRFEKGRIVEHWDVVQPIPEKAANDNTMF